MKDILIIEDGRQERERLTTLFKEAGYAVQACEGVSEAENVLKQDDFRLAILDIGLNDRSGSYLFNSLKKGGKVSYVIIFTGNPSVHLKQRFIEEGAIDYVIKASPQAQNSSFLSRIKEILGQPLAPKKTGLNLTTFVEQYLNDKSKNLFFDADNTFPPCSGCSGRDYVVVFNHQAQVPPEVTGQVVCSQCGRMMDPEIK